MENMVNKWGQAAAQRGFAQIPNDLLRLNNFLNKEHRLTPVELLVVLQLVGYWWQKEKMPFLGMAKLAEHLGVSERQVQRAIARLSKDGLIAKTNRRMQGVISSNTYDLAPLVELVDSIAKGHENARPGEIKRGGLKASATSGDLPKLDADDLPRKGIAPSKEMEAAVSTGNEPDQVSETNLNKGGDMSWFKPYSL
jgi:predicted transcriptional regulator